MSPHIWMISIWLEALALIVLAREDVSYGAVAGGAIFTCFMIYPFALVAAMAGPVFFAWFVLLFFSQGTIMGGAVKSLNSREFTLGLLGLAAAAVNIMFFFNIFW